MTQPRLFTGVSKNNDFHEALRQAIATAKQTLTTDFVTWKLSFVSGQDGGFILEETLRVGILASPPSLQQEVAEEAYFEMTDGFMNPSPFIIALRDPDKIKHARNIVSGKEILAQHVLGTIIKETAAYNPGWSYHFDPDSIEFFELAAEVCDASIQYVEDNLDEAGGAFLPDCTWCPWSSTLVSEVFPA